MALHTHSCSWFLLLSVLSLCLIQSSSDDAEYAKSLLKFKQSLTNTTMLNNWQEPVDALCSWNTPIWTGCVCLKGSFVGLRLENMSLGGKLDIDAISDLPIVSLSVMNNNVSGPFPSDVNKLGKLRSLYLANNSFNGEIPDEAFSGMKAIRRVVLGDNDFEGKIPVSLLGLPKLVDLQLQNNQFGGRIPDFWQADLVVNFANNRLEGDIPASLSNQNASSFYGNLNLCGKPLDPCKQNNSLKKIAFITAPVLGLSLIIFITFFLVCLKRRQRLKYQKSVNHSQPENPNSDIPVGCKNIEHGKLYFVRNDREKFELPELLKASAEVLGSGSFGSSYKAVLVSGQTFVVRRFKQMNNVGKEEFYEHMRRIGRLSHRNLLPLVAFYYREEEKLLINDFVENGSLASHLHGKRNLDQPPLNWPTRLRIIKGVTRGLSYLYKELPTLTLPHGHLKSSNVLLDSTYEPLLSDYALSPVINKEHAQQFMVAYKSPESTHNDTLTRKTDMWSLGILILELLTGRFPANFLKEGNGSSADLATWVNSVVREEWTGEVFDKDLSLAKCAEGQMLRLLKIGMCCCECNVEKRWDLREVVDRIEELKEKDGSDDDYSYASYVSEGDLYSSSRGVIGDEFSFSIA